MTTLQRVTLAILIVAILAFIGSFIWGYSSWPISVLFIVAVTLNGVRRNPGARNAQENDPNRR